jgi:predicted O-linked N-acetylglucosamine transferase (SPINDLY family)
VDVHGHTRDHRMGALARRPAPVQVELLGFPSTVGASYMDYIIGDGIVIPENERRFYTEAVAELPDTYWPTDDRMETPVDIPGRAACGLPAQGFVFCDFNQLYKLTPAIFAVWMRILRQTPGSVLWLLENNRLCSENLRREAGLAGVAPERLVFAPSTSQKKHLARLKLADLCIDTLPYNAHTTTTDALWLGVPMVTCRGNAFAGRVAASLLCAMNMSELVTENLEAYEKLILDLAGDPARLVAVRRKLEAQRRAPLFDTDRYRRHLESAFVTMWERWQRGLAPQSFAVAREKP